VTLTVAKAKAYLADAEQRHGWKPEAFYRYDSRVKVAYADVIELVEAWLRARRKPKRR
jgi:hypothetical protein